MTSVTNNILVVGCSEGCASLVQEAFPYVHVEELCDAKTAIVRMRKDPPVHALLLDCKAFNPKYWLDILQSFQRLFPEIPIIVINHKEEAGENDSELIIKHGAQDVINTPLTVEVLRTTIIRSIARHSVRREFDPIEKEIEKIKTDVATHGKDFRERCENCSFVPKILSAVRG